MIFLLVCGLAFAAAFVLKLLSDNAWLALVTPPMGGAVLAFVGREGPDISLMLTFLASLGLFGAAWGVLAAKMLTERARKREASQS
jgi:hypothetical protein